MARRTTPAASPKAPKIRGLDTQARPERRSSIAHVVHDRPFVLYFSLVGGLSSFYSTDAGVLPSLRVQPLVSGLQGIVERREGEYDLEGFLSNCRDAHFHVLTDWEEYCIPYAGGYVAAHVLDDAGKPRRAADAEAAYLAWLEEQIDAGRLLAPIVEDIDAVISDLRTLSDRYRVEYRALLAQGEDVSDLGILARRIKAAQTQAAELRGSEAT